jgi:hypothetical protein
VRERLRERLGGSQLNQQRIILVSNANGVLLLSYGIS